MCVKQRYSDGCSSLQVLLDLSGVLVVESSSFSVEPHVPVVDVVHILVISVWPTTTEL